jgi:putative Holliday junction resolvase
MENYSNPFTGSPVYRLTRSPAHPFTGSPVHRFPPLWVTLDHVRVLGIDYGRTRVGLALSDATGMLARPWKTLVLTGSISSVAAAIAREVAHLREESDGLGTIVIGFPRRLSGEPNEQTPLVHALASSLTALAGGIPVVLQDERLSSREAEELLSRREKDWRRRKPLLDAAAAAVILQDYLDTHPSPTT